METCVAVLFREGKRKTESIRKKKENKNLHGQISNCLEVKEKSPKILLKYLINLNHIFESN